MKIKVLEDILVNLEHKAKGDTAEVDEVFGRELIRHKRAVEVTGAKEDKVEAPKQEPAKK